MVKDHKCLNCLCDLKENGMYNKKDKYTYCKFDDNSDFYAVDYHNRLDVDTTNLKENCLYCSNCNSVIGTTKSIEKYLDVDIIPF